MCAYSQFTSFHCWAGFGENLPNNTLAPFLYPLWCRRPIPLPSGKFWPIHCNVYNVEYPTSLVHHQRTCRRTTSRSWRTCGTLSARTMTSTTRKTYRPQPRTTSPTTSRSTTPSTSSSPSLPCRVNLCQVRVRSHGATNTATVMSHMNEFYPSTLIMRIISQHKEIIIISKPTLLWGKTNSKLKKISFENRSAYFLNEITFISPKISTLKYLYIDLSEAPSFSRLLSLVVKKV